MQDSSTHAGRRGHGGRGPGRIDPEDRAQLAESPVDPRRVLALFSPHRLAIAFVVALIVTSSVISLAQPFLVREIIDVALPQGDTSLLIWAVAAMIGIAVATAVLGVVQTWQSTKVGQAVMHRLRTQAFSHVQDQSMAFFTRVRTGEVQSRLTNDIGGMQNVVTTTATSIASNVTTVVGTAVAMLALSWRLSLLSLIVIPPAIWVSRRVALMRRDKTTELQRRMADLQSQIDERLSVNGALLIKTLGAGRRSSDQFEGASSDVADLEVKSQLAGRWRMSTMTIVFSVIPALIYLAAGFPATSGGMTIGTLVAFSALQATIFRPILGLLSVGVQWVSSMALFSRIFGYLDLPVEVTAPSDPARFEKSEVRGDVVLDDISFRYPKADRDALSSINVQVPAGTSLAVVGETGSGKTTLGGLVARLADPTSGAVRIDGVDVRDIAPEDLAAVVGVVSQETYLIHGTIRENLLLAKPDASDIELWRALAAAQIDELVAGLPEQLETKVGSRGHRFSGGEKQRIAVARTLLRDPRVLVLDEPNNSMGCSFRTPRFYRRGRATSRPDARRRLLGRRYGVPCRTAPVGRGGR
ncbi:ATP-binding cassette domain-containing protein [Epidermidibacterium keratini]|uniref:ATP-binding cassette domain-containing protein n=1 Tax=Epidermidibacterium keratini TaxID=1891644 RepID=A0A7L4YM43_9ACTN|nr:ABC transporter ATP-binding protein [Epidermidibacterium keratini]QHB99952.1 ATP-binding cassette domain-containing protein [Epidermidibacterium keratini]